MFWTGVVVGLAFMAGLRALEEFLGEKRAQRRSRLLEDERRAAVAAFQVEVEDLARAEVRKAGEEADRIYERVKSLTDRMFADARTAQLRAIRTGGVLPDRECDCDLRDRKWNPFTSKCETCGGRTKPSILPQVSPQKEE